MRRAQKRESSIYCVEPFIPTAISDERAIGDESSDSEFTLMKTQEGHRRRSVLRKLKGWWKKRSSYYMDIQQELRQDNTLFHDEGSIGLTEYNDTFDAASFSPSPAAKQLLQMPTHNFDMPPRENAPFSPSVYSLEMPQTPNHSIRPPQCSPMRSTHSQASPCLTPRATNRHPSPQYTPCIFSPPVFPERNIISDWKTPPMQESTLIATPFVRSASLSAESLLSIDSLDNSYTDDDDVDDQSCPTHDFFEEHVTFLRMQTQPRSVQRVFDEG